MEKFETITFGQVLPNKAGIESLSSEIITQVKDGYIDPVDLIIKLTAIGDVCAIIRSGITEDVVNQLDLEKGKLEKYGAKLEKAEVGVKYDYSNNPKWTEFKMQADEVKEKMSALEKRLKTIPAGSLLVDEESGETLIGPAKTSTTSFKITLGK